MLSPTLLETGIKLLDITDADVNVFRLSLVQEFSFNMIEDSSLTWERSALFAPVS
uniref:Uncharacterized protein n=1 Tax=Arion vulgaris TaxID=1028688 RepID=A0A0B6YQ45_9EUPU